MTAPKISVLMAVYNAAPFLAASLESVLNQTYEDFELLVVDDGSSDESVQIVERFQATDSRIVFLRNATNSGQSAVLNQALRTARGEYITRQDADDVSLPDRLARQIDFLHNNVSIGAVGCAAWLIDTSDRPLGSANLLTGHEEIASQLLDQMCLCGPTVMARRESFQRAGFFFDSELSGSEDYDLCVRLSEVTEVDNLPVCLYKYRQHSSATSQQRRFRQMYNKALALERAIYRRYGPEPTAEQFGQVGRDYLRAAILGVVSDKETEAKEALERALRFNPAILDAGEPVETIVTRYTPAVSAEEALAFTRRLFDEFLPANRHMARARARLLARLHMREVFASIQNGEPERVNKHLISGIRHDPRWLFNRGVASLVTRQVLRLR